MDRKINFDLMNMSTFTRYQKLGSISVLVRELVKNYDPVDAWLSISTKVKGKVGRKTKVVSIPASAPSFFHPFIIYFLILLPRRFSTSNSFIADCKITFEIHAHTNGRGDEYVLDKYG